MYAALKHYALTEDYNYNWEHLINWIYLKNN